MPRSPKLPLPLVRHYCPEAGSLMADLVDQTVPSLLACGWPGRADILLGLTANYADTLGWPTRATASFMAGFITACVQPLRELFITEPSAALFYLLTVHEPWQSAALPAVAHMAPGCIAWADAHPDYRKVAAPIAKHLHADVPCWLVQPGIEGVS